MVFIFLGVVLISLIAIVLGCLAIVSALSNIYGNDDLKDGAHIKKS